MKEYPILFKPEMVRAIMDGRKTQTRRVVKPKDPWECAPEPQVQHEVKPSLLESGEWGWIFDGCTYGIIGRSPYGKLGDFLWVREGLKRGDWLAGDDDAIYYAADGEPAWDITRPCAWVWKRETLPSIHMPRGLARIFLRVLDVRVERLREISTDDAQREGFDCVARPESNYCGRGFRHAWDEFNAKRGYSWDDNPWVWVVSFERTEAPK